MAACCAGAASLPAQADTITIQQYFSPAPNALGSPSWNAYMTNALTALRTGQSAIGNPATDPTAYYQLGAFFQPGMAEVTSYNSWMGQANPTGAFASEYGVRLHAGVVILDTDGTFTLGDVTFAFHSSDTAGNYSDPTYCPSGNGGSLCYEGDLSGTNFSSKRIGINFGADGIAGTADDIIYDSSNVGSDSVAINELIYVGVGNAFWPGGDDPNPANPAAGKQASLDDATAYIMGNNLKISNTYCVKGTCDTISVAAPEPASLGLLTLGAGVVGMLRRRRKQR